MKRVFLLFFTFCFITLNTNAQVNAADSAVSAFIPNFAYSYQIPGGDVAKTFGNNSTIGGGFFYKTKKNLLFSLDMNYIFGNSIKNPESILSMVLTNQDHIIDGNGTYALFTLYERGYTLNFRIGKILNVMSVTPNSGLMIMGGIGYMEHKLVIDNQFDTAPQITGDYAKGYDRLTVGININEFIGYFYMGRSKILNFYGGFEFFQGFTKSKRDYVFDLQGKDTGSKLDLYFGFRIGWMIPIFKRAPDKYYYY
ncbi:MAG: hypothetical protein C0598_07285 [Marinilabiliales bacterium]|nr:MAG: hypothetical protein C0598_07285 [Marinilabiliales bacterium]